MFPDHPRFRQLSFLGGGSFGVVFRAYDEELALEVALKTLIEANDADFYVLKREFRLVADVRHQNLIELFELFVSTSGKPFFTMEFVSGLPFNQALQWRRRERPPVAADGNAGPEEAVVDRIHQLIAAVHCLHLAGVMHCDIKPSNVLVQDTGRVVVLDFGLGKRMVPVNPLLRVSTGGTWAYMAPELALGETATEATDWYSVAALVYETVTGVFPFRGAPFEMLQQKRQWAAKKSLSPPLPIPKLLWEMVLAGLDPDPRLRPEEEEWAELIATHAAPAEPRAPVLQTRNVFVGRDEERAKLDAAFWRVLQGYPATVHVTGPAGIGKTQLIEHFLESLPNRHTACVLHGRCNPAEAVPFNAFDGIADELAAVLTELPAEQRPQLSPDQWKDLVALFPVLRALSPQDAARPDPTPSRLPIEERRRGFAAFRALLDRLSRLMPVVVWIEDLHWADADSHVLLHAVLRGVHQPSLLLILSYRKESDSIGLLSEPGTATPGAQPAWEERIALEPLPPAQARLLAEHYQRTANACATTDLEPLLYEAGGSPLLIVQLLAHARAGGAGRSSSASPSLGRILTERLRALPLPGRLMVEAAVVAGHPVPKQSLIEAGGIGEKGRLALRQAVDALLLRMLPGRGDTEVDVFHQRVGEALLASIPAPTRAAHHSFWLRCALIQGEQDPERVLLHALGAGETRTAAEWAARAAQRAEGKLAFARAADLYGQALTLATWSPAQALELEQRRAEALVSAGRGAEAAPLFAAASTHARGKERGVFLQRAAEQYLVSGLLGEGTAVLREVLRNAKLPYPRSGTAASLRVLGRIVRSYWKQRLGWGPRRAGANRWRVQLEAAESAAKGLAFVDPLRGLYFALRRLTAATALGDQEQLALALCTTGATLLPIRGPFSRWARRLIAEGCGLAESQASPYVRATVCQTLAQVSMLECRWNEMSTLCEEALGLLQRHCPRQRWEVAVATMAKLRAEEELGRIEALRRDAWEWLEQASALGDRYSACVAWEYFGWACLLFGDTATARHAVQRVEALWIPAGFQMQHFYAARLSAYAELVDGRPEAAWERAQVLWQKARAHGLLRHILLGLDADLLLLRTWAAHATALGDGTTRPPRWLARRAAALRKSPRADARGYAALVEAGSAAVRGNAEVARAQLAEATTCFEAAQMSLARRLATYLIRPNEVMGLAQRPLFTTSTEQTSANRPDLQLLTRIFAPGFVRASHFDRA